MPSNIHLGMTRKWFVCEEYRRKIPANSPAFPNCDPLPLSTTSRSNPSFVYQDPFPRLAQRSPLVSAMDIYTLNPISEAVAQYDVVPWTVESRCKRRNATDVSEIYVSLVIHAFPFSSFPFLMFLRLMGYPIVPSPLLWSS